MDTTKLIERTQRNLATRQGALKNTLEEIKILEAAGVSPQAVFYAKTKRDRQNNAVLASEQLLAALGKKAK